MADTDEGAGSGTAWNEVELVGRGVRLEPMHADHVDGLLRAAAEDRRTYGLTVVPADRDEMTAYVQAALAARDRDEAVPFVIRDLRDAPRDHGGTGPAPAAGRIVGSTRFLDLGFWRPTRDSTTPRSTTSFRTTATTSASASAVGGSTTVSTVVTTSVDGWATHTVHVGGAATGHATYTEHGSRTTDSPHTTGDVVPSVAEIGHTWLAASAQRTAINTETKLLLLTHAFEVWQALRVCLKTDVRNARSRAAIERLGARFEGIRRAHMLASDGGIRDTAYYSITRDEWPGIRAGLAHRLRRS